MKTPNTSLATTPRLLLMFATVLLTLLAAFAPSPARAQDTGPTVTTDKEDYPPFSVVWITGTGFQPGETVSNIVVQMAGPDAGAEYEPWTVVADENGNFETSWLVFSDELLGTTLQLTSTGLSSSLSAQTTFSDDACQKLGSIAVLNQTPKPVLPGGIATYDLTITRGDFTCAGGGTLHVTLTVSGLPAGATVLGPTSIDLDSKTFTTNLQFRIQTLSTLTFTAPYTTYPFTVSGDSTGSKAPRVVHPDLLVGTGLFLGPDAVPDAASTGQNTSVTVNVLANDVIGGASITNVAVGQTLPSNGTVVKNANDTFTYTPTASFVGDDTFSYIIKDGNGLTDEALVTITVTDAAAPTITCPDPVTVSCATAVPAPDTSLVTASSTCPGTVTKTHVGDVISGQTCDNKYTITRTYRATDACGHSSTCTQTITVNDTTPPTIICSANVTNECGTTPSFTTPTASDTCGTATVSIVGTVSNLVCGNTFVSTRTWRATDQCGNTAECSQTIATVDTTPPTITCSANVTNECGTATTFTLPTATDTCGTNVITEVSTVTVTNCGNTFVSTRTWRATDACGNTAQCSQTIATVDTTPPTITCSANVTNECGTTPSFTTPTASDTCGTATVSVVGTVSNLVCGNTFVSTRTWRATDQCGNTAQCSQTIATVDTTPPTITCSPNVTNQCTASIDFTAPTATDTCGTNTISVVDTVTNATCGNTFVATRTWRATDACGNTAQCSQTIATVDTTPPTITCSPNATNQCGAVIDFTAPTASDTCGTNTISLVDTVTNATCGNTFVATRTWTATDACGNTAQCSQTIATVDTNAPTITCSPNVTNQCTASIDFTAPTASDTCGTNTISVVSTTTNATCGNTFVATRTWRATDACGNTAQCSQTIATIDTTPPTITCSANATNECGSAISFTTPTASDTCGTNTISVVSTTTNVTCGNTFVATRTWRATDACGNTAQCSQTIATIDTTPPSITCSANVTNQCGTAISFTAPTSSDSCGTNTISIVSTTTNLPCGNTFIATRTWRATDQCGNTAQCSQTIATVDTTPPTITCSANVTNQCGAAIDFTFPTASDTCGTNVVSGDPDDLIAVSGPGVDVTIVSTTTNAACGNTFVATRTWRATDQCGNTSQCSQTIATIDTIPPSITCSANVTNQCGTATDFTTPTASDTCGTNAISIVNTTTNATCGNTFVATRTWRATDACGNTAQCSQTIATIDTTRPTITCSPNVTNQCGVATDFTTPTASDSCGTNTISIVGTTTNATCGNTFVATRIWRATDACGNTAQCSQTIATIDTTPPTITCSPNVTNQCGTATDFTTPTASDSCGTNVISVASTTTNLTCGNTFVATRTWTATDACGNTAQCSQTIATVDTNAPTISGCPANITTNAGTGCQQTVTWTEPTAADTCTSGPLNFFSRSHAPGATFALGTTKVCYVFKDACFNSSTCTFNVTVTNTAPVVSVTHDDVSISVPSSLEVNYGDPMGDVAITATDSDSDAGSLVISYLYYKKDGGGVVSNLPPLLAITGPTSPGAHTNEWNVTGIINLGNDVLTIGTYDITVVVQDQCGASGTNTFRIIVRPNCVTAAGAAQPMYIGQTYVATDVNGSAQIALSAGLKACAGDIRTARVTFALRNSDGSFTVIPSASNLRVGLIDPANTNIGTAATIVTWNLGQKETSQCLQIAIIVGGNYTNNNPYNDELVTIAKPADKASICGGGKIDNGTESSGYLKGLPGLADGTRVYFDVTYTKSGSNPQGKVNILVHSIKNPDGVSPDYAFPHCYKITSTAIASLALTDKGKAVFTSKCTLQDITDPNNITSVDGGATLQISATDGAQLIPTTSDFVSIYVLKKSGGVWFVNKLDAATLKAVESVLVSGNLWVK